MAPEIEQSFQLTRERMNRGHTPYSLAKELDIDYRTLQRLEAGEAVHPAKAKIVADYFGVKVTDLMPADPDSGKAAA